MNFQLARWGVTGELLTPKEKESIDRDCVRSVKLSPRENQLSINPSCEMKDGEAARKTARLELNISDPSYHTRPFGYHPRNSFSEVAFGLPQRDYTPPEGCAAFQRREFG